MKAYVLLYIIVLLNIISNSKSETKVEEIMDWGKKNKLEISPLIEISLENGKKKFIAKENIDEKKEILKIPYTTTFDIEKTIDLLNSKELKSQYELFKKLDIKTYEPFNVDLQKQEIFLSYLLYLIQNQTDLYKNTKFCEQYKLYLLSIKEYLPRSPLFYTPDQIEYLSGTFLGKSLDKVKSLFKDEINVFKNESYFKKDLDFKDYAHFRLFIENNGLDIFRHISLIPFLNFFERDYMRYNARFQIEKSGDIKIFAKKKINKGEKIIVNSPRRTSVERLIFEGISNSHYVNYRENYIIPAFSPGLYYKYDIDDLDLYKTHFINLIEREFDSRAVHIYKNYTKLFKGDEGDAWAYGVLLENIDYYKKYVESLNTTRINNIFENKDDRTNVERAMKGEFKLLEKSYLYIQNKFEGLKEKEKEKKNKKSTDL